MVLRYKCIFKNSTFLKLFGMIESVDLLIYHIHGQMHHDDITFSVLSRK